MTGEPTSGDIAEMEADFKKARHTNGDDTIGLGWALDAWHAAGSPLTGDAADSFDQDLFNVADGECLTWMRRQAGWSS